MKSYKVSFFDENDLYGELLLEANSEEDIYEHMAMEYPEYSIEDVKLMKPLTFEE